MDRNKSREVVYRRRQDVAPDPADATALTSSAPIRPETPALEDPTDDIPVSNLAPDIDERFSAAPSYGEMGPPAAVAGSLKFEPVGGAPADVIAPPAPEPAAQPDTTNLLDAWYASYGHPALTRLLRQPEVTGALAALTADSDERAQITETEAYPWRCVCALTITAADGSRWLGSGWLAGLRTVITAGHCLYMPARGGWVRQIEVIPGGNGSQQPYGSCVATSFRSVRGWTRRQHWGYDYGAIILPVDRAFGNLLGHLGYLNLSDHDLRDLPVNVAGYPNDKPRGTLWYGAHRLELVTARTLEYAVTTLGGASGAPVWQLKAGQRYVVGIHTHGDLAGNSAVRLSAPVFANINAWRHESG
jgi:V8-like Glu-specific endopeptidase